MIKLTPIVSRSKIKCYKAQKVLKYALNSQLQALQILTNDDEVENWRLSSFFLTAFGPPHLNFVPNNLKPFSLPANGPKLGPTQWIKRYVMYQVRVEGITQYFFA